VFARVYKNCPVENSHKPVENSHKPVENSSFTCGKLHKPVENLIRLWNTCGKLFVYLWKTFIVLWKTLRVLIILIPPVQLFYIPWV
jgi:hypothetical protein